MATTSSKGTTNGPQARPLALPPAPSVLVVAGLGGTATAVTDATALGGTPVALYGAFLVPLGVYGAYLLAAATSLPLLRRTVRPAELRYA